MQYKNYKKPTKHEIRRLVRLLKDRKFRKIKTILVKSIFLLLIIEALNGKNFFYGYYVKKKRIYIIHRYNPQLIVRSSTKLHEKKWRVTKDHCKIYVNIKKPLKINSHEIIKKLFLNYHGSTFFIWTKEYGIINDVFFIRNKKKLKHQGILLFRINCLNNQN